MIWPSSADRRQKSLSKRLRPSGVVACVDSSRYLAGVCDHAAWFADRLSTSIELLCVDERVPPARGGRSQEPGCSRRSPPRQNPVFTAAATRLFDEGADVLEFCTARGRFAPVAAELARGAQVTVIGRRGCSGESRSSGVGSSVPELLRLSQSPVCIAPRVFFPIHRALVVVDGETASDPQFGDRLALLPCLDGLDVRLATPEERGESVSLRILHDEPRSDGVVGPAPPSRGRPRQCDLVVFPNGTSLEPAAPRPLERAARRLVGARLPLLFC